MATIANAKQMHELIIFQHFICCFRYFIIENDIKI